MKPKPMTVKDAEVIVKIHSHQAKAIVKDIEFNPLHEVRYLYTRAEAFLAGRKSGLEEAAKIVLAKYDHLLTPEFLALKIRLRIGPER